MPRPKKEQPNRKDGLYEVKITTGKTLEGKLIRKSFYSSISKDDARRQAEEWKVSQKVAQQTGNIFVEKSVTFADWARKWLETYKEGKVKEHTYHFTYRTNVENYLIPYFGQAALENIRQADVQKYFNQKSTGKKQLAQSTLEKHKMILHDIFEKAIYNDLCYKNPVVNIKFQAKKISERAVWNAKQAEAAYTHAKTNPNYTGIAIMLQTGIRRSELIGLMWDDINFNDNLIHIQRAVVPTTGKIVEGGTKTEQSNRIIPISDDFKNYLLSFSRESDYVLCNKQGERLSPNTYAYQFKNYMRKFAEETALPILTPHELRHTYGTVLRERGVDLYTIQKVMGHADISITAKIYVHNDIEVLKKNLGV